MLMVDEQSADVAAAARLEGARILAREAAHLLGNDLTVALGRLDLLRERDDLPPYVRATLDEALEGLYAAARHLAELQQVRQVVTRDSPVGPSLDLGGSR